MSLTLNEILIIVQYMLDDENYKFAQVCKEYKPLSVDLDISNPQTFFMYKNELTDAFKYYTIQEEGNKIHHNYILGAALKLKYNGFNYNIIDDQLTKRTQLRFQILQKQFPDIRLEFNPEKMNYICFDAKDVIINSNVKSLKFAKCHNLEKVLIPTNVSKLLNFCFLCCENLKIVIIEGRINKIPDFCFKDCYNLQQITFTNSVKRICYAAFEGCKMLKSFDTGDYIETLDSCFRDCDNLEFIRLGSNVREFGKIKNCPKLKKIKIDTKKILLFSPIWNQDIEIEGKFDSTIYNEGFKTEDFNFSWNNFNNILNINNFKINKINNDTFKYTLTCCAEGGDYFFVIYHEFVRFDFKYEDIKKAIQQIFYDAKEIEISTKYKIFHDYEVYSVKDLKINKSTKLIFRNNVKDFYDIFPNFR